MVYRLQLANSLEEKPQKDNDDIEDDFDLSSSYITIMYSESANKFLKKHGITQQLNKDRKDFLQKQTFLGVSSSSDKPAVVENRHNDIML